MAMVSKCEPVDHVVVLTILMQITQTSRFCTAINQQIRTSGMFSDQFHNWLWIKMVSRRKKFG